MRADGDLPDWLLVARSNHYGLSKDAEILLRAIRGAGSRAEATEQRRRGFAAWLLRRPAADRLLHVERALPRWLAAGGENWLIPNQERFPRRHLGRLKSLTGVMAKTRHAAEIFSALGVKTEYLGFTSEDRLDPLLEKDWTLCFHLAGGSTLKGTEDLLALWKSRPDWPELVLVQKASNAPRRVPANVRLISGYLADAELKRLQNICGIHLCPSRAEGWGHYIVEGLSVGSVVITTDGAPMNEHLDSVSGMLVAAARSERRGLGFNYYVRPQALEEAIERAIAMSPKEKAAIGRAARSRYEAIEADFKRRSGELFRPA